MAWAAWYYILQVFTLLANVWMEKSYSPVLDWLSIPVSVLIGGVVTGMLVRLWPSFLRIPESVSRLRLAFRVLSYAPLVLMMLLVFFLRSSPVWMNG